jgi:ABC-type transporter Mla MlaB component
VARTQPSGEAGGQVNVILVGAAPMTCRRRAGLPHVDASTPAVPAVLTVPGPVGRDAVPELCDAVRALLETTGAGVVVCDVGGLGPPGLAAVDLLARLQLTARRAGGRIRLRDPGPGLHALLDLVGLRFEVEGQTEQREPALGVQEAVEPGDPAG